MEKLLIVDGNSILNRAYYGIRILTAPDGTPINAVYGFLNILYKYLEEEKPDYLCVAFDVKAKTFRHKMYDLYKAQRKPAPEDFLAQIPLIKEVLAAMNCACIEKEGYEADDLIGTVSLLCEEKGIECRILTGDKDDLQLASENTVIKLVVTRMGQTTTTDYGRQEVEQKYGVTPEEYIEVKALMGDASDNIPGVKGIGEKTAFSLIQEYKSIDAIYDRLEELNVSPSVRKKLTEGQSNALLSKKLSVIDRHVPFDYDFASFRIQKPNLSVLRPLFLRLNFQSFLRKLPAETAGEDNGIEKIHAELKRIEENRLSAILKPDEQWSYVLDWKEGAPALYFTADGKTVFGVSDISRDGLQAFFSDADIWKCGYNVKEDLLKLHNLDTQFCGIGFDIMLAAYLAEPTRSGYDLGTLCSAYLHVQLEDAALHVEEDGQLTMDFGSEDKENRQIVADRVSAVFALHSYFAEKLEKDGQHTLYYDIELPLAEVLADMQETGVYVDKEALSQFGKTLSERITGLTSEIYEQAGEEFNINSPKQLGVILFDKLKLPGGKKNKNGYSTNAEVLGRLAGKHPVIDLILEYRKLTKLQSTYVEGLLPMIDIKTGRIHSNFNQTVTATGRISSTEPNLQNIPVRTELGREIRRMFIAEGDRCLVDADYSQIELRVLAHISGDKTMQEAFVNHLDIHAQTASQVFGVPIEQVTPAMRSRAKAVNFGIVYGIGAFSLAQDLHIPIKEADAYIKGYLRHYPLVDAYMKKTVEDARTNGYVSTLMGRRRYMPELRASNRNVQAFGERVAMNAPIQGTAADIIKAAMVRVYARLKSEKLKSKLILQVHDELIVEALPDETDRVKQILREEMENACKMNVPLEVDLHSGKSWFDTK